MAATLASATHGHTHLGHVFCDAAILAIGHENHSRHQYPESEKHGSVLQSDSAENCQNIENDFLPPPSPYRRSKLHTVSTDTKAAFKSGEIRERIRAYRKTVGRTIEQDEPGRWNARQSAK